MITLNDMISFGWINYKNNKHKLSKSKIKQAEIIKFLNNNKIEENILIGGIYQYLNKIKNECIMCGKPTTFKNFLDGYRLFCSNKCGSKSTITKNKRANTNILKYGSAVTSQNKEISDKISKTKQKLTEEEKTIINNKKIKTSIKNFGYEHHTKNPKFKIHFVDILKNRSEEEKLATKIKTQNTNLNKSEEEKLATKIKTQNTNLNKFGVVNAMQSDIIKNKVRMTKNINTKNRHLKYLSNNNYIENNKFNIDKFMQENNVGKSLTNRIKIKYNITTPNKNKRCKTQFDIFNFINTPNKLWNDKKLLNGLELDIVLPDNNLAIEYNGIMFHSIGKSKYTMFNTIGKFDKNYHLDKTNKVNKLGFKLFHIFENEWLNNKKQLIWKSMINNELKINKKIYARKCNIIVISDNKISNEFLNNNHLQGECRSKIKIGLEYLGELVSIMTFGKARMSNKYEYEV